MANKATSVKKSKPHYYSPVNSKRLFKQVFFTILSLTLISGGTSLWLASQEHLSPLQKFVFETSSATCKMGIEAIFGLLGEKAKDPSHQEEDQDK